MENTCKATLVGILDIVSGVSALVSVFWLIIAITATGGALDFAGVWIPMNVTAILWSIAILFFIVGILALVGGFYALQREKWGLALTGSIAITFFCFFVGILAIIFTALSKDEFA